jgi:S1-C subfamily serine protease
MKIGRFPDEMDTIVQEVRRTLKWVLPLLIVCVIGFILSIGGTWYRSATWRSPEEKKPNKPQPPGEGEKSSQPYPNWYNGVLRVVAGDTSGSGFLIRTNYVLSNAHVVDNALNGQVTLYFSKDYKDANLQGKVVWQGKPTGGKEDIALIEVPPQDKSLVCPIGTSGQVRKTERVRPLGYPLGVDELKITEGIISGILLTTKLFQTDAVINMGNSGGALVSLEQNAVIGLIVSEADTVEGEKVIEGTNFAIMIDYVMEQIKSYTSSP